MITVTATQGSAEADCTVLVINDTSGEIDSVSPQSDGSFTARHRRPARRRDPDRPHGRRRQPDPRLLSHLQGARRPLPGHRQGGQGRRGGGLLLEIPEGALVGPAVVKITPVLESALPHPVPAEGQVPRRASTSIPAASPSRKRSPSRFPSRPTCPKTPSPSSPGRSLTPTPTAARSRSTRSSTRPRSSNGRLTSACPPFDGPDRLRDLHLPLSLPRPWRGR